MNAALEDVRYASDGPVATITLDRPDARNAYSNAMVHGLVAALDRAEADREIRVIVLTGAGKAFSAGGDLKQMRDRSGMFAGEAAELRRRYIDGIHRIPRRIARCEKPMIAAINGAAIGAGLDLACMCDLRIAAGGAKLGSTFVKVGLIPGDGGAYFLARTIGFARALELVLTGRVLTAEQGLAIGLVHEVVDRESLYEAVTTRAHEIAALPPVAVALTKRAAYRSWGASLDEALEMAATYQGISQTTEDHQA
ncbi:MAG: enoyl-CoA hydratase-related protein, partial [Nannocystaceae bacterium]